MDAVGGLLLAALGTWVLTLRPRTPATAGLGLFAAGFGLASALSNLSFGVTAPEPVAVGIAVAALPPLVPAVVGVLLVGAAIPSPLTRRDRPRLVAALAVGVAMALPPLVAVATLGAPRDLAALGLPASLAPTVAANWAGAGFVAAASWAALFLLAARFPDVAANPADTRAVVLVTIALLLWPSVWSAHFLMQEAPLHRTVAASSIVATAALAALWLRASRLAGHGRTARNVALFVCAWPLAAAGYASATGGGVGAFGVARSLAVLILAYAILRHRLLGLDVKVRWTLSKSTLAAMFIAVFFVASEAAQQFFGDTLGSTYAGILAAGGLVFAAAPLSRMADRIAARAVPVEPTPPSDRREEAYRAALRLARRDGALGRGMERDLATLQEALAIAPTRAVELRESVERDEAADAREVP